MPPELSATEPIRQSASGLAEELRHGGLVPGLREAAAVNGRHGRRRRAGLRVMTRDLDRHQRLTSPLASAASHRAAADRAGVSVGERLAALGGDLRRALRRSAEARAAAPRRGARARAAASASSAAPLPDRDAKHRRQQVRGLVRRDQERARRACARLRHKGRDRACRAWHRPRRRTARRLRVARARARAITVRLSVPNSFGAGHERQTARRGNGDAHAGEAAGAGRRGDQVELGEGDAALGHRPRPPSASAPRHGRAPSPPARTKTACAPRRRPRAARPSRRPCWCRARGYSSAVS